MSRPSPDRSMTRRRASKPLPSNTPQAVGERGRERGAGAGEPAAGRADAVGEAGGARRIADPGPADADRLLRAVRPLHEGDGDAVDAGVPGLPAALPAAGRRARSRRSAGRTRRRRRSSRYRRRAPARDRPARRATVDAAPTEPKPASRSAGVRRADAEPRSSAATSPSPQHGRAARAAQARRRLSARLRPPPPAGRPARSRPCAPRRSRRRSRPDRRSRWRAAG